MKKKEEEEAHVVEANERKYSLQSLRKDSLAIFGVTLSTFDGANYGKEGEIFTLAEMKARLDEWKKAGLVQPEKKEGE